MNKAVDYKGYIELNMILDKEVKLLMEPDVVVNFLDTLAVWSMVENPVSFWTRSYDRVYACRK